MINKQFLKNIKGSEEQAAVSQSKSERNRGTFGNQRLDRSNGRLCRKCGRRHMEDA